MHMLFILFLSFPLIANTAELLNRVTEKISEIEQFEKSINETILMLNGLPGAAAFTFLKKNNLLLENTPSNPENSNLDALTIFKLIDKNKLEAYLEKENISKNEFIELFKTLKNYEQAAALIEDFFKNIQKKEFVLMQNINEIKNEQPVLKNETKEAKTEANKKINQPKINFREKEKEDKDKLAAIKNLQNRFEQIEKKTIVEDKIGKDIKKKTHKMITDYDKKAEKIDNLIQKKISEQDKALEDRIKERKEKNKSKKNNKN